MPGINQKDLNILAYYVDRGNRELYWNYLAHTPGNDGYATLALGVVRNDNAPGATANAFAANHARTHDGKVLTEREWNIFGVDLILRDLELRQRHVGQNRPDAALNLPVEDVRRAHDQALDQAQIDPDAWTPRQLLDAAHRQGGDRAAEEVWQQMLDNSLLGIRRGASTAYDMVARDDAELASGPYLADVTLARAQAAVSRNHVDPDRIGADSFYYRYDPSHGQWSQVNAHDNLRPFRPVTDAAQIEALDDTRALRLERQTLRTQFHPDDPYRGLPIVKSPWLLAEVESDAIDRSVPATQASAVPATTPDQPGHACNALYQQCMIGVRKLGAGQGRDFEEDSQRLSASLSRLALEHGMTRVDHVLLGADTPGAVRNVFVVQGGLDHPGNHWARMPVQDAVATPVEASFRQIAESQSLHLARFDSMPDERPEEPAQRPAAMRM